MYNSIKNNNKKKNYHGNGKMSRTVGLVPINKLESSTFHSDYSLQA